MEMYRRENHAPQGEGGNGPVFLSQNIGPVAECIANYYGLRTFVGANTTTTLNVEFERIAYAIRSGKDSAGFPTSTSVTSSTSGVVMVPGEFTELASIELARNNRLHTIGDLKRELRKMVEDPNPYGDEFNPGDEYNGGAL